MKHDRVPRVRSVSLLTRKRFQFAGAVVIGAILLPLIFIGGLVLCILAAIASNKGEQYKYPVNWRLIK